MDKRVLMVATVPSMIGQFNMNNIKILLEMGYQVDAAADFKDTSIWPEERVRKLKEQLAKMNVDCIQLDFSRSPLKLNRHIQSYKETVRLLKDKKYAFIHTHTPIASAIVRLACNTTGTKVIYTAHGFHFYKGAPLKNWIIFYPVEKWLSKYTDLLITINQEDYKRARKSFRAKSVEFVPGVGVDTERFSPNISGRMRIRHELGLDDKQIMLLSVGELNDNKNHASVIKAIKGIQNLTYVIVGKGSKEQELKELSERLNVDLRLTGFRYDVDDFYRAADVFVLPSIREGLNVSLMEAMASGLAVACGNIRGNTDLIQNKECLFNPRRIEEIRRAIKAACNNRQELGRQNIEKISNYSVSKVSVCMENLYRI